MATVDQLIKTTFSEVFRKYLYDELTIGRLAHVDFKDAMKKGDTVDIIMPGSITLSDSDGNTLTTDAEQVQVATVQVKIDKCKSVYFTIDDAKLDQIENAKDDKAKIDLIKEYSIDAVKKFAAAVDEAYGGLYTRAGFTLQSSALTLTSANVRKFFAHMNAKFKRGDGNGHTSWVSGKMLAVVPPEMTALLAEMADLQYVESRAKQIVNGYVGRLHGWDIIESNNVANPSEGHYYPMFGQEGATLAGGIQSNFKLISNIPDKGFNTEYKGKGSFGVGAPRADLLGTQDCVITLSMAE